MINRRLQAQAIQRRLSCSQKILSEKTLQTILLTLSGGLRQTDYVL